MQVTPLTLAPVPPYMDTCPYCGEEQRALKNHVRLASGDGHGPSGTYPDNFADGTTPDPTPPLVDDAEGRESGADAGEEDPSSEEGVSPSPEAEASHSTPHADVDAPSGEESGDLVAGNGGEVIYGSESKKADPLPACRKCGNGTVSADHALYILGGYYQKKSSLRVFARRRLKKIAGNIERKNPSYVCPSCWTAFG